MKKTLSLLLCLLMVLNLTFGLNVSATSPGKGDADLAATGVNGTESSPYTVDNFYSLRDLFRSHPEGLSTMYIKLAADISYSGYEQATLETTGIDIVLDLAGYTLSCSDESNNSFHLIHAADGSVTITDSLRYDEAADKWYYGKIDYLYTLPDRDTAVMSGNIIIRGGTIVNRTHSSYGKVNCVYTNAGDYSAGTYINKNYYDGSIQIYGGTLEADHPLYLGYLPGSGIYGGTLNVKNHIAVWISALNSKAEYTSEKIPTVTECKINNASGKDQIAAFQLHIPQSYSSTHTAEQALSVFSGNISDEAVAYIDGKRPYSLNEELRAGTTEVWGPMFSNSFELFIPRTVENMELTIPEPEPGDRMSYRASAPFGSGYDVDYNYKPSSTWQGGVQWTDGNNYAAEYEPGTVFEAGKKYEVFIKVKIPDTRKYTFADESVLTAEINGKKALFYSLEEGSYVVYRSFSVERKVIGDIKLTVTEPTAGGTPIYGASSPQDANYAVETTNNSGGLRLGTAWMHEDSSSLAVDEKFEKDKKYTILIMVDTVDSVRFEFADADQITATVNGYTASVIPYSATKYGIYYQFDLATIVSTVAVNIPNPRAGDRIQWSASTPSPTYMIDTSTTGAHYGNGVAWYKGDSHITVGQKTYFVAGETYRVVIAVKISVGYNFASVDNQTATVNGQTATFNGYTATKRYVSYTFTVKQPIDTIEITIPEPTPGVELSYEPTLPEGAAYKSAGSYGPMWKNAMAWKIGKTILRVSDHPVAQEGVSYTAVMTFRPKDETNYQFAAEEKINATVNGNKADNVFFDNAGSLTVVYTFNPQKTVISLINVTVPEPKVGDAITYNSAVTPGMGYDISPVTVNEVYYENGMLWLKNGNVLDRNNDPVFESGARYTLQVFVGVTDSNLYEFDSRANMTALINGRSANYDQVLPTHYLLEYTFKMPTVVEKIEVTLPDLDPVPGHHMTYDARVPEGAPYRIQSYTNAEEGFRDGVAWFDFDGKPITEDSPVFEDVVYSVCINVELTDDKYEFAKVKDIEATINDVPYFMLTKLSNNVYQICMKYIITMPTEGYPTEPDPTEPKITYMLGDVDISGKVNVFDASYILKGTTGTKDYPDYKNMDSSSIDFKRADVDGTGSINIFDAAIVLKYATGDKSVEKYGIGNIITV